MNVEKGLLLKKIPLILKNKNFNIHLHYVAETLISYFRNFIDSLKTENTGIDSAKLFLKNYFPQGFPIMLKIRIS
jgi:hypothetical protein